MPGRVLEVHDDEARVVFRIAPGVTNDFGLDDDVAGVIPSYGGIAALAALSPLPRHSDYDRLNESTQEG